MAMNSHSPSWARTSKTRLAIAPRHWRGCASVCLSRILIILGNLRFAGGLVEFDRSRESLLGFSTIHDFKPPALPQVPDRLSRFAAERVTIRIEMHLEAQNCRSGPELTDSDTCGRTVRPPGRRAHRFCLPRSNSRP